MLRYALFMHTLLAKAMQKRTGHQHFWRSLRQVFLVFGRSGWIGGLVGEILTQQGAKYEYANARLEDRAGILADIERVRCQALTMRSSSDLALCALCDAETWRAQNASRTLAASQWSEKRLSCIV